VTLFEIVIGLLVAGALLTGWARRLGAPYPAFLALAGAGLALVPSAPTLSLAPQLVLVLFVAPVLMDAAFDASPRDMREYWRPIITGAVIAVLLTVAAVALVARWLVPDMPWPVAITLGAIVAPPDAAAASAVLRTLRPPRRITVVLEGESMLNDATALLVYRVAATAALGSWTGWPEAPGLALSILGGVALGSGFGLLVPRALNLIDDVPTSVILQFFSVFALWTVADRLALSPVIATVSYAITLARIVPGLTGARRRIQSYAVWEVAVFVLNVLAFIITGLQLRPILAGLPDWRHYAAFAGAVLLAVIMTRIVWVACYNTVARWRDRRYGVWKSGVATPPTIGSGVTIAWCGMRGIITLATALALPEGPDGFPYRSLILFSAFITVLGTLVLQGLTLRPLMRLLHLAADGVVEREIRFARSRTARAALESLADYQGPFADALRAEFGARMLPVEEGDADAAASVALPVEPRRRALAAERETLLALRRQDAIGDDAFHAVEAELDWHEMYVDGRLDL